jgi:choice-of-anchor A domain-containing protein
MVSWRFSALALLAALLFAPAARATALSAAELVAAEAALTNFNLILSGDLTSTSETEGRAVIGGSITSSSSNVRFCFNGCTGNTGALVSGGPSYGSLTVYGNVGASTTAFNGDIHVAGSVASGATMSTANANAVYVGGSNAGTIATGNLYVTGANAGTVQNGTAHTGQPQSTTFPYSSFATSFGNPLSDLSTTLGNLAPQQTISSNPGNNYVFNAMPTLQNGVLVTVYQIAASVLSGMQNISGFNLNGASVVIVNVLGSTTSLPNLNNFAGASAVIWNFVDETGSLVTQGWAGTILAPDATITNNGNLVGTVYASSLTQNAELHSQLFTGDLSFLSTSTPVPEPAGWAVMAMALLPLPLLRRRRRA